VSILAGLAPNRRGKRVATIRLMPREDLHEADLDALIRTSIAGPIAIGLAETLLQEAGIPFFVMGQDTAARQESGNFLGWLDIRVPKEREDEAREILRSVEQAK
jgi:hypothetical protein